MSLSLGLRLPIATILRTGTPHSGVFGSEPEAFYAAVLPASLLCSQVTDLELERPRMY